MSDDTGFSSGIGLGDVGPSDQPATDTDQQPSDDNGDGGWWQTGDGPGLRLIHAGPFENAPEGRPAIGLLFSAALPENGNFNEFLAVYRPDGTPVEGEWRRSASPQLLYFDVPDTGEYRVHVRAGLSAGGSETLTKSLSGPVTVGGDGESAD